MNVKKSALLASMLAVTLAACAAAPAFAAKRDQPVTAPNVTVTTDTSCEPLPNPFPIPVPKVPVSEPWPGLSTMTKMFPMLRFLTRSIQTAPSC